LHQRYLHLRSSVSSKEQIRGETVSYERLLADIFPQVAYIVTG
jgi:hypothetical protein